MCRVTLADVIVPLLFASSLLSADAAGDHGDTPGVPRMIQGDLFTYEGDPAHPEINITCFAPQLGEFDTVQIYKSLLFWSLLNNNVTLDGRRDDGELRYLISTGEAINATNHGERYSIVRDGNHFIFNIINPEAMDSGVYTCRAVLQDDPEGTVIMESENQVNVTIIEPVSAFLVFTAENWANMEYAQDGAVDVAGDDDFYVGCEAWLNNGLPIIRVYWENDNGNRTAVDEKDWKYRQGVVVQESPVFNDSNFFHAVNHSLIYYTNASNIRDMIRSHVGQELVFKVSFPGLTMLPFSASFRIEADSSSVTGDGGDTTSFRNSTVYGGARGNSTNPSMAVDNVVNTSIGADDDDSNSPSGDASDGGGSNGAGTWSKTPGHVLLFAVGVLLAWTMWRPVP